MKRTMVAMALLMAVVVLVWLAIRPVGLEMADLPLHEPDPANGRVLFDAGGCVSCHSSGSGDADRLLLGGGLEMHTPFGLFRAPNISTHPSSGIGDWSMADFVNAMHAGVSPDKRHYYPAFPYASYTRMSLQDLMDMKSYMDTLPAVEKVSGEHDLKFPFNIRAGLGLWKLFNLDSSFVEQRNDGDSQWERGRYLVEGPGHCGECHTPRNWMGGLDRTPIQFLGEWHSPRNWMGGLDRTQWLAGGRNPDGEGSIPNITPHENGLAEWSAGDIEYYLSSGFTPDFDTVGGSMVKVQENMARLSPEDLAAIAAYLKSIPSLD